MTSTSIDVVCATRSGRVVRRTFPAWGLVALSTQAHNTFTVFWNRKTRIAASAVAPASIADALTLTPQAHGLIQDFSTRTRIDKKVLEREFRLLKLYVAQTAIQNIVNEQPSIARMEADFDEWISKLPELSPNYSELVSLWPRRREEFDQAWANPGIGGSCGAVGAAFSRACGDEYGVLTEFAGDMLAMLTSEKIVQLRSCRLSND